MESMASIPETSVSLPITYLPQRDVEGTLYSPSGHDIGYTSLREHSLLPADHSGLVAMRGPIHLPPFYHEPGPMLVGAYLFPPFHDIRHLPAGDSKSGILLCKESTSRIIFEEIYMIDLYFHNKLNQSYFFTLNFCHAYRNDSILFVSKRSNIVPKMTQASFSFLNSNA